MSVLANTRLESGDHIGHTGLRLSSFCVQRFITESYRTLEQALCAFAVTGQFVNLGCRGNQD